MNGSQLKKMSQKIIISVSSFFRLLNLLSNCVSWVVWPFNYYGIQGKPLHVGDRVSFLENKVSCIPTTLLF